MYQVSLVLNSEIGTSPTVPLTGVVLSDAWADWMMANVGATVAVALSTSALQIYVAILRSLNLAELTTDGQVFTDMVTFMGAVGNFASGSIAWQIDEIV